MKKIFLINMCLIILAPHILHAAGLGKASGTGYVVGLIFAVVAGVVYIVRALVTPDSSIICGTEEQRICPSYSGKGETDSFFHRIKPVSQDIIIRNVLLIFSAIILIFSAIIILGSGSCSCSGDKKGCNIEVNNPVTFQKPQPQVVNVYFENSVSMDGYFNGVTEFKQTISRYLTDIYQSGIADSINIFDINRRTMLVNSNVQNFQSIANMTDTQFRTQGQAQKGDRSFTDLSAIVKEVLDSTNDNSVSILISDFIFSPGRIDANLLLDGQYIGVRTAMANHLNEHSNTAVVVYQLESQFRGVYFNKIDNPIMIAAVRPYYIWVIGNVDAINELRKREPNGVRNVFSIVQGNIEVNYAIRPNLGGDFESNKKCPTYSIIKAKKARNGKLTFGVDVDFSWFPLDATYLMDNSNYEVIPKNYELSVSQNTTPGSRNSHLLTLSSAVVFPITLSVQLKSVFPKWVIQINDDDGMNIIPDDAMQKTYGFKYLIQGIYDAYTFENNAYTEIKININK